ncbi:hypothetical protein N9C66_00405 [Akkermansiaceae bacterium]|nr:hypothetical protein [Akkermansiaceae bacterium]MDB4680522.1 hypothetical protein [Akkermansiaceae bacterium]
MIAIDLFGDMDREVNGVTFRTDGQTAGGGSASEGIVTAVTTAANQINDWAPAPIYTNGDATSAANLAEMMRDIRWMNVPNPVTVDVSGLYPGGLYEVQLLTNKGRDANRRWDIAVEDQLVVDDYSSEGSTAAPAQVWAADNSFVYRGDFTVSEDGELNVLMQRQIGGRAWPGGDGNPILQAMIVHLDQAQVNIRPKLFGPASRVFVMSGARGLPIPDKISYSTSYPDPATSNSPIQVVCVVGRHRAS